MTISKFEGDN